MGQYLFRIEFENGKQIEIGGAGAMLLCILADWFAELGVIHFTEEGETQ